MRSERKFNPAPKFTVLSKRIGIIIQNSKVAAAEFLANDDPHSFGGGWIVGIVNVYPEDKLGEIADL